jgi:uncharacterized protein (DUF924 family)
MTGPVEVLDFWFADTLTNPDSLAGRRAIWFMGGPDIDQLITKKFGTLPDAALAGELQHWATDARNMLALVLVLDQFPRNIYRNTARAYHYDAAGLNLAVNIIDHDLNLSLHPIEQSFLFLPLEHSEAIEDQTRAVQLYETLTTQSSGPYLESAKNSLDYAKRHCDIIRRFGRFPHRNAILGRESTEAELDFLAAGGDTFGMAPTQGE